MLSTAWAIWLAWTLPGLLGFFYGQPSAVLWKSQLFVAINERSYSPGALYRGELRSDRGIDKPAEYANPIMARFADQPQLEIRDDRVLLATPGKGASITLVGRRLFQAAVDRLQKSVHWLCSLRYSART